MRLIIILSAAALLLCCQSTSTSERRADPEFITERFVRAAVPLRQLDLVAREARGAPSLEAMTAVLRPQGVQVEWTDLRTAVGEGPSDHTLMRYIVWACQEIGR